jgi:exopolyphosphatase/guanosine-5'-triphosphate,3'-diphosphate pyrophosphatase
MIHTSSFSRRLQQIRQWVGRRLGDTRHEQRVMRIAVRLFDLTAVRHGLDRAHRRILKLGALLHDVGRCYGSGKHHTRGARLVLQATGLPLRPQERRAVAYLTRYHRRAVPEGDPEGLLGQDDDLPAIRMLLALLRAADTLDSRRLTPPGLAICLRGRRLRIRCYVRNRWRQAQRAFQRRRKFRLLAQTLALSVRIQLRRLTQTTVS